MFHEFSAPCFPPTATEIFKLRKSSDNDSLTCCRRSGSVQFISKEQEFGSKCKMSFFKALEILKILHGHCLERFP